MGKRDKSIVFLQQVMELVMKNIDGYVKGYKTTGLLL